MDFYGTAADYTSYHTARGRDVSDHSDVAVESALLVASEWLDGSFGDQWPGLRAANRTLQTRDWPRTWVRDYDGHPVDYTTTPIEITFATYEAAYRHITDPTALLVDYTPGKYKSVRVEGAVAVEYRSLDASTVQKQFPIIGHLLRRILGSRGGLSALSSGTTRV